MTRLTGILTLLTFLLTLTACGTADLSVAEAETDTLPAAGKTVQTGTQTTAELVNPYCPAGETTFAENGYPIRVPSGAENPVCFLIDSDPEIAEISFFWDGFDCRLRSSSDTGDFSGICGDPANTDYFLAENGSSVTVKDFAGLGCRTSSWQSGDFSYILTVYGDDLSEEQMEAFVNGVNDAAAF